MIDALSWTPRPRPDGDPLADALSTPAVPPPVTEDVRTWWPRHRALAARHPAPFALAVAGGLAADRAAWAFGSGYQAALRALAPGLPDDLVAAFCVTEEGGNRPRDILTVFRDAGNGSLSVTGAKRWSTLGPESGLLLVAGMLDMGPGAAPEGDPIGAGARGSIRVLVVPADTPGVRIEAMPPTRFVPELPHARIRFEAARVPSTLLLPGDGYDRYVKPFRTIEDTHIAAAMLAWLLREARCRGWPTDFAEQCVAALCALERVASMDAASPACHVALTGVLGWVHRCYDAAGALWAGSGDEAAAARWIRDTALFGMAANTRQLRAARAWERLSPTRAA